ncbi:hypothetical protein BGZ95_004699 [Linnemannia exigua]|uniref:Uncharacterized protein n=1 Tax=Linnemannia exigua TaxID=604196 RepID=A0AAD4HB29_9FUNG|nr:hypothetical protein BGZ95_004699 [Linnemannia exigua]
MEDDRKQRFRFHKEDEILLLNIVLRATPSPYSISTRDGAIMVAWNNIAEEFKGSCKPRPDGKVPHSRTCRTRCDKMIVDYLAMQASPQHRGKKLESKDDRIKNELVARLSALQGKGLDPNFIAATAAEATAGVGTGVGGNSPSNSDDPISNLSPAISSASGIPGSGELIGHVTGSASGSSLMTPGQVLGRASGHQGINDSPLLDHTGHLQQHHHQQHHHQHHQQQDRYQQHHHQQLTSHQAASELIAASALLLPTTMGGMHSSPHQDTTSTSTSTNLFATPESNAETTKVDKKGKQVVGSRKRRVKNTEGQAQQKPATVSTASFEAIQRQSLSNSTANTGTSQTSVLPNTKRLRSAGKQTSATTTTATLPSYQSQQEQEQQLQEVNSGRTMMGVLGHDIGSGFTSNDLTALSSLGSNTHNHSFPEIHGVHSFGEDNDDGADHDDNNNVDDDEGDDANTEFQDTQDAFDSNYDNSFEHDLEGVSLAAHMEASTLLSFQKGGGNNSGSGSGGGYRKNKNSKQMTMSDNNGHSKSSSSSTRNKGSNGGGGSGSGLRGGYNNNNSSNNGGGGGGGGGGAAGLGFGGMSMISTGFGAGGFLQPSQLNADDRAFLMRTLALEEKRVKVEVDKVALERERLALENRRLEWKMQQMNH